MSQDFHTIRYEVAAAVATLTLDRPQRLNSFNRLMHEEVGVALDLVRAGRVEGRLRVLVITGAGRAFCAGEDLSDRAVEADSEARDLGAAVDAFYKPLVLALRTLEVPVIAAVNGVAAGAGANLALACDLVVAARSASFVQSYCRLGLVPDTGGSWMLPRLVGPARAMGLALLGDKLPAEQAERWGLIWKCVDDEQFAATVQQLAATLASGPTAAYARIKQAVWASWSRDLSAQLDLERDLVQACGRTEDYREAVDAFMDKRLPRFSGR